MRLLLTAACLLALATAAPATAADTNTANNTAAHQQNPIYQELLTKGVPLANGKSVKLPAPAMADGLDAAAQRAVLEKLAPPGRTKEFMRGGFSDDFKLEMNDERGPGSKSVGRRVDLYFVAKGSLSTITSEDFIKQQVERGEGSKVEFYTKEELDERKLTVNETTNLKDRYAHAVMPLFDMVQVSGSGHAIRTDGPESALVAFKLDPRFANDPQYPNQWRAITKVDGKKIIGDPEPYAGSGAYVKATVLKEPAGAVFVEYHLVFDEPYGWWAGKEVLKSKLPDQYRQDVRRFRRNLAEFEKKETPGEEGK